MQVKLEAVLAILHQNYGKMFLETEEAVNAVTNLM